MLRCFDHTTTFPDTHGHFCPAIEIPRKFPIVCGGLELNKINLKNKPDWIRSLFFPKQTLFLGKQFLCPYVKTQGLSHANIIFSESTIVHQPSSSSALGVCADDFILSLVLIPSSLPSSHPLLK